MGNFFRCVRARANLHALMTQKSCAVGMRNAILRNHLKKEKNWCRKKERLKNENKKKKNMRESKTETHTRVGVAELRQKVVFTN